MKCSVLETFTESFLMSWNNDSFPQNTDLISWKKNLFFPKILIWYLKIMTYFLLNIFISCYNGSFSQIINWIYWNNYLFSSHQRHFFYFNKVNWYSQSKKISNYSGIVSRKNDLLSHYFDMVSPYFGTISRYCKILSQ